MANLPRRRNSEVSAEDLNDWIDRLEKLIQEIKEINGELDCE